MNRNHKTAAIAVGFALCFGLGMLTNSMASRLRYGETWGEMQALGELETVISTNFHEEVDNDKLYVGAAKGMVSALEDRYATYYTGEEYAEYRQKQSGKYTGIGITLTQQTDGAFAVVMVYTNSPADKAGVLPDDILTAIDGQSTAAMSMDDLLSHIKAAGEESIGLTFRRGETEYTVSLHNEEIVANRVNYKMLEGNVAYIHLLEFTGTCVEDFKAAVEQAQNDSARALVLDLRGNLGGQLDLMLEIADVLLDEGVVLTIQSRSGEDEVYRSGDGMLGLPLAVLVNGNSASASEALAGALQGRRVGYLIGTTTYGKGIVQTTYPLSESGGWVKMTTGAYYTPNGRCIHGEGLTPDLEIFLPEEEAGKSVDLLTLEQDTQLRAALDYLR